jgi:hypothetical protein
LGVLLAVTDKGDGAAMVDAVYFDGFSVRSLLSQNEVLGYPPSGRSIFFMSKR